MTRDEALGQLALNVPTYPGPNDEDYGEPRVPVLISECDGVRILLGSHDRKANVPDILVERRAYGWMIFIHPIAGLDPVGYFGILDDGQSFWAPEMQYPGAPPGTQILDEHQDMPGIDDPT